MQSLQALRNHLTAANPILSANPEILSVFAQKGTLSCGGQDSLSYSVAYTAELFIIGFPGDPASVFIPLLSWVRTHQPHLLDGMGPDGLPKTLTFDAELVDKSAVDISIQLEITDLTIVTRRPANAGGDSEDFSERWQVRHPAPPARLGESLEAQTVQLVDAAGTVLATLSEPASRF